MNVYEQNLLKRASSMNIRLFLLILVFMPSCVLSVPSKRKIIAVIGTGYVGLVTGAGLAHIGNNIICADIDKDKIEALKQGKIPIFEPGLDVLVKENVETGRLSFTTDVEEAIRSADVIFTAVGTPMGDDGSADLKFIEAVTNTIAHNMNGYKVIVTKSTVPIGTGAWIKKMMLQEGISQDQFDVVSNPEFLREGVAVQDFLHPDRIVVGTETEKARAIMQDIYQPMIDQNTAILFTNIPSSETIKYASNGFLAIKIAYINEIANFCRAAGADVYEVARGMGMDRRIGSMFLVPGPGFGGSCFPKDCHALVHIAQTHNTDMRVIQATLQANEYQKELAAKRIAQMLGTVAGKNIAILGLAFKANTDDVRYSPSINTIQALLQQQAHVCAYDPVASKNMQMLIPPSENMTYAESPYEAAKNAHACIVMTEWAEFKALDLKKLGLLMAAKKLLDMRGIIDQEKAQDADFDFDAIGFIKKIVSRGLLF